MIRLLIFFLPIFLFAQDVTLDWLNTKPRSIAKDFYIWRFLNQDITAQEADEAFYQTYRVTHLILNKWISKTNNKHLKEYLRCTGIKAEHLVAEKDVDCLVNSISISKAIALNDKDRATLITKLQEKYPKKALIVEAMASKNLFADLTGKYSNLFFDVFNNTSQEFREKELNKPLSKDFLNSLDNVKGFNIAISTIVTNNVYDKLQQSLFNINSAELSHDANFFLAMNTIKYNKLKEADIYLEIALNKANLQSEKDKVYFWKYLLTKDELYLHKLSQSWDLNFYTLYANEKLGIEPSNIITEVKYKSDKIVGFDIADPFAWSEIISEKLTDEKLSEYINKFNTKDTIPHLTFLLEKANGYKKIYYIRPYEEYLQDVAPLRKSLIYALAKQESRFVPASISPSYAMGIMQIMPFLSKAIATQRNEEYDVDEMFEPKLSYDYSNFHLDYLEKHLIHPLFISYAYNGGIGFTKKMLTTGGLFKNSKFDPYLSMELVPYIESRIYGKKVLTNYVIYRKLLNQPISLTKLMETMKNPYDGKPTTETKSTTEVKTTK